MGNSWRNKVEPGAKSVRACMTWVRSKIRTIIIPRGMLAKYLIFVFKTKVLDLWAERNDIDLYPWAYVHRRQRRLKSSGIRYSFVRPRGLSGFRL